MDDDRLERIENKIDMCLAGMTCLIEAEGVRNGCRIGSTKRQRQEQVVMFMKKFVELFE